MQEFGLFPFWCGKLDFFLLLFLVITVVSFVGSHYLWDASVKYMYSFLMAVGTVANRECIDY